VNILISVHTGIIWCTLNPEYQSNITGINDMME